MDDFSDDSQKELGQDDESNESDYTDVEDEAQEEDDYGSEASTIKCAPTPAAPPCIKRKNLIKKKKQNKKSKKRNKKNKKKNNDPQEDGAGALVPPELHDDEDFFRTPHFICGFLEDSDGDFLYLIKWVDDGLEPTMDYILAAFVNQRWGHLLIQFYDDLSERFMNGEWTVADYGDELYFFMKYGTLPPHSNDDDADWTGIPPFLG